MGRMNATARQSLRTSAVASCLINHAQLMEAESRSDSWSKCGVAIADYFAILPGELDLSRGQTVTVLRAEGAFWYGRVGQDEGVFPLTVVELCPPGCACTANINNSHWQRELCTSNQTSPVLFAHQQ